jgi:hypothetical protein
MDTNTISRSYLRISLGAEELALALALVNRPDIGRNILASVNEKASEEQVSASLTAAGHSLVARGLCSFMEDNRLAMNKEFEYAIFPLARFDNLLYVTIVQDGKQDDATIHVVEKRFFTAHIVQHGFIHHLEHGPFTALADYMAGIFGNFGEETSKSSLSLEIKMNVLRRVQEPEAELVKAQQLLVENGWPKDTAKKFVDDLDKQQYRGTIVRLDANGGMKVGELEQAPRRVQMLLKGAGHSWLFEFPSASEQAIGTARLVARNTFMKTLTSLIA